MAKSMTVGKRENEKKRLAKREAKLKRKEGRKSTKSSFDDMIAYVDEYGMITSTPPEENIKKQEINVEEIMISTPRKEDEEPVILRGRIEFFNEARGFGFIKDLAGIEKYFFHVNNVVTDVREGNVVTFDLERGAKGMNAVNICLERYYQTEPRDDVNINCVNIKIINKNPLIVKQKTNMIEEKVAKTIKSRNQERKFYV